MSVETILVVSIFVVLFVFSTVFLVEMARHVMQIAEDLRYMRMQTDQSVKQNTKTNRDIAMTYAGAIALSFLTVFLLGRAFSAFGLL